MRKKYLWLAVAIVAIAVVWAGATYWEKTHRAFSGQAPLWVRVPHGSTEESLLDSLRSNLGPYYAEAVHDTWKMIGGQPVKATGAYLISPGDKSIDVARRLRAGVQTPVKVTFNNVRLFNELPAKIAPAMEFSEADFQAACDSILSHEGYAQADYPGLFFPDTYEFYWSATPASVVKRLLDYHDKFWTEERQQKARALGLSPREVTIIASIVEEESAKADEYPTIGRLYINRLKKGMKLQADPTVKFAVGDFALRRILQKHLETPSPYNTYQVNGLPPGPIRMPRKTTVDAILNSLPNDYLYMCAKEDFSGRHNFATTLTRHNENARRYRAALNARGIK